MSIFKDNAKFNEACGTAPGTPVSSTAYLYRRLFAEETTEIAEAIQKLDAAVEVNEAGAVWIKDHVAYVQAVTELADGCIDAIYILAGWLYVMGLDGQHVWNLVQRANMAKVDPETGLVTKRGDGKILKPEGWVSPDGAIKQHVAKALGYIKREVKDVDAFIADSTRTEGKVTEALKQASLVERMFSIDEAARICGVSRALISEAIEAGQLKHKVFGKNTVRIGESALAEFQAA